jgi:hypothetical protein
VSDTGGVRGRLRRPARHGPVLRRRARRSPRASARCPHPRRPNHTCAVGRVSEGVDPRAIRGGCERQPASSSQLSHVAGQSTRYAPRTQDTPVASTPSEGGAGGGRAGKQGGWRAAALGGGLSLHVASFLAAVCTAIYLWKSPCLPRNVERARPPTQGGGGLRWGGAGCARLVVWPVLGRVRRRRLRRALGRLHRKLLAVRCELCRLCGVWRAP